MEVWFIQSTGIHQQANCSNCSDFRPDAIQYRKLAFEWQLVVLTCCTRLLLSLLGDILEPHIHQRLWCLTGQRYPNSPCIHWRSFTHQRWLQLCFTRNHCFPHCWLLLCPQIPTKEWHNSIYPTWTILNAKLDPRSFWEDWELYPPNHCHCIHLLPDLFESRWISSRWQTLHPHCHFLHA